MASLSLAARTVAVRVLREQDGRRSVVSHLAKHTRGEVVHPAVKALLGAGPDRKAAPASDQGTQSADPPITAPSTVPTGKGQNG